MCHHDVGLHQGADGGSLSFRALQRQKYQVKGGSQCGRQKEGGKGIQLVTETEITTRDRD